MNLRHSLLRATRPALRTLRSRHTLAAGLTLGLLAGVPSQAAELLKLSPAQAEAAQLRTQPAQTANAANTGANLVLQGTVMLPSQATDLVSAPVAGVVQAVLVSPGQSVRAGTPVARLLSPQLVEWQRDWLQADTQAQLARERLQRDEQLFAEGIIAEQRLRETRGQARMAQVTLDERSQALRLAGVSAQQLKHPALDASLTLVAPASGTVLELSATPGQRLDAGMPVARLARAGLLSIEVQASQQQLGWLKVGDALKVEGCKTPARLAAITPQVSSASQAALLRADFSGGENCLRVNQFVQLHAAAALPASGAISVPTAALVQHEGQPHVFVKRAQGYEPVAVRTGAAGGTQITVLSGLKAGDEVVVQGTAALKGLWQGLGLEGAPAEAPTTPTKAK